MTEKGRWRHFRIGRLTARCGHSPPAESGVQIASLFSPTWYSRAGRCGFEDENERVRGEAGVEFIRSTPLSFALLMIQTYKVKYHEPT